MPKTKHARAITHTRALRLLRKWFGKAAVIHDFGPAFTPEMRAGAQTRLTEAKSLIAQLEAANVILTRQADLLRKEVADLNRINIRRFVVGFSDPAGIQSKGQGDTLAEAMEEAEATRPAPIKRRQKSHHQ